MLFVSLVPHAHIKHDTGEETTLRYTEEETNGEKAGEILGDTHEGTDNAPCEG